MKKTLGIVLAGVLVLVGMAGVGGAQEGWPDQLRFMAGPPGGNWFALGGALADLWTKGTLQTTSSTGGGVSNVINTDNGKGDLGFSVTSLVGAALKGEEPFKKATPHAVVLANLYRQYTYFIMRKDYAEKNGVKSVGDVVAKKLPLRFATLKPGTASEFVVKALFAKGYGVSYDDLKAWGGSVEFSSYEDGGNLLADNHLDCFAFSVGGTASTVMQIEQQVDVVILPIDDAARNALADAYGTVTFTVEPGVYQCVTEPVPVVGDYTCIVGRRDLPDDLVTALCRTMWEDKGNLEKAVGDMKELTPGEAVPEKVASHPAAAAYWAGVR